MVWYNDKVVFLEWKNKVELEFSNANTLKT